MDLIQCLKCGYQYTRVCTGKERFDVWGGYPLGQGQNTCITWDARPGCYGAARWVAGAFTV
jgi:hypothetical protein